MKRYLLIFVLLLPLFLRTAVAGNAGGTGGNSYVDEFKGYRTWALRILRADHTTFEKEFGYTSEEYEKALQRLEHVQFIKKNGLGTQVRIGTELKSVSDILPKPIDELFRIDGEEKDAINITREGVDLVIIDTKRWDSLDGKSSRKLQLIAHELFGILELESTGEDTHSKRFEDLMVRFPKFAPGGVPIVPLWDAPFEAEILISDGTTCSSESNQDKLKVAMGERCRAQLSSELPAPYFDYECAFSGELWERVDRRWQRSTYRTRAYVPGQSEHHSYYYRDYYRYFYEIWDTYRPGYFINRTTTVDTVTHQKLCRASGTLYLTGIDPIGKMGQAKRLKTSEGSWEEAISRLDINPEASAIDRCFEYRKSIRKGLVNHSHCKVYALADGNWRWELWAVHPFQSEYSWSEK